MDFNTLNRRELQALCKLNKIPANITNIAMAEALQSLDTVVGIEEYLNVSKTAETGESLETVDVLSPKAPLTRCRTSTRPRVKIAESESVQSTTVTRTARRGSKQVVVEVEEAKSTLLKTPAVSRTKKAPVTTARRNVGKQLNECEKEVAEEGLVENKYSTRRSTRIIARSVKKGSEKAVKINSFSDQVDDSMSNEAVEVPENKEVDDICNAFVKLDVEVEECDGVNTLKQETDETSNQGEVTNDEVNDDESSPCDDEKLAQKLDLGDSFMSAMKEDINVMVPEEQKLNLGEEAIEQKENNIGCDAVVSAEADAEIGHEDSINQTNDIRSEQADAELVQEDTVGADSEMATQTNDAVSAEAVAELVQEDTICADSEMTIQADAIVFAEADADLVEEDTHCADSEMATQTNDIVSPEADADLVEEDTLCADSEMTNQVHHTIESMISDDIEDPIDETTTPEVEEMPENTVDETVVAITDIDNNSNMTEEVEDSKPELFTENNVNEMSDAADSGPTQAMVVETDVTIEKAAQFKIVSDNKENKVDEGKVGKKDEIKSLNAAEISMRQLKKQLKALTLKNISSKEDATTRTALQAVSENRMVVDAEIEN